MIGCPRVSAYDLIETVLDEGSWRSWDEPLPDVAEPDSSYAVELATACERAGTDEALITGEGRIAGHRVALIVGEFAFLAGSIGLGAAGRAVAAIERATSEKLPLFASPASGGTRMQEGTPAFVTMVTITAAINAFKKQRLPYITYLRHPTTGGVLASWGSLGHVTVGEPGATIGFLGARVHDALHDTPFPPGVQTAENLFAHGLLDAVLPVDELADTAARFLDLSVSQPAPGDPERPGRAREARRGRVGEPPLQEPLRATDDPDGALADVDAWEAVLATRDPARPGLRSLLKLGADEVLPLSGTGAGERDSSLLLALARFSGQACVVLGHDRRAELAEAPLGPGGLRAARRGIRLASELALPLVSVIDTAGAALSKEAEEGGLAGEIARCLSELADLDVPTVCVLLGQGTGGGALALLPADRVVAADQSWLSPLPPEGASAILFRTTSRAPELARRQRVRALDLRALGLVDRIVAELPAAADHPDQFCARVGQTIAEELISLEHLDVDLRHEVRRARYRNLPTGSGFAGSADVR